MPGIETLVDGLDHPEGVAWDAGAGVLYAGGEAGQVYEVDLEQRRWRQVAEAPGFVLGLVVRLDGTVPDGLAFTDDGGGGACYRPDRIYHLAADGSLSVLAEDPQGTRLGAATNVCFAYSSGTT